MGPCSTPLPFRGDPSSLLPTPFPRPVISPSAILIETVLSIWHICRPRLLTVVVKGIPFSSGSGYLGHPVWVTAPPHRCATPLGSRMYVNLRLEVIFNILCLPLAVFAFVFALNAVHLLVIWDFAIDLEKP